MWSINERLSGRKGLDIERLGTDWYEDVLDLIRAEAEHRPRGSDEMDLEDLIEDMEG